ncbi:MAG: HEAT repeat domain-containing protein, partial [Myxococcota bacterium]|nr:HEAT repeat domain-containing protein [Myxococcota bacterium]
TPTPTAKIPPPTPRFFTTTVTPRPPRAGIDERLALLDALLALGFDPVEPLDQDHRACLQAKGIAAPKVSAEHGLDVLLALSHSNVKEQRVRAIAGLRHLLSAPPDSQPLAKWDAQTQEARARLHALLDDPEPWVQYHTILALQQLGSSESIPALLQRLDQFKPTSPSDSRLGKALELLGSLVQRTPTQLELVLTGTSKVLADEETNEPTLLSACKALQSVGAPAVIAPLMALLERPSSKLRRAAAQALEGLSYPPRDGVERLRIALALERVGECWGTVAETDWLAVFSPSFAPGPSLGRNTLAEKERMAMGLSLLEHGSEAAVEALLDWLFEPPLVLHTPEPRTQWAKRAERLFGAYASLLVGAALGLDQFYSRQGACEEYSYGHGPALQAIELLRHDPSPMATRLLQCVLRKQPIELLTMHYEEYHTQFEAIDFVEEHNAARRALGERGLGD